MFENFQLALIAKSGAQMRLLRVPLHQDLQASLAESWAQQYAAFVAGIQEVDFNAGYTPEEHECFRLLDYALPNWLRDESSQTIQHLAPISAHEELMVSAKGIAAFARNEQGEEMVLFQNFSRSHVIQPGRFLFLERDTYVSAPNAGLSLDGKLSALYLPLQQKLLFLNFRTTNSFLPLAEFFVEASEQEIREILNHPLLAPENPEALAVGANQWFRKRFAMLQDSGILNQYTAQDIAQHSAGYGVDIHLAGDKIVFPADKGDAKRLLLFLNEELFRGAITETLYETNSKREAD